MINDLVSRKTLYIYINELWAYGQTRSLLMAMIMQVTLTACIITHWPHGISGVDYLIYDPVTTATMRWVVVAVVTLANGEYLSRQPLRK